MDLRLMAGGEHPAGLAEVQTHRFFEHDMLPGGGGGEGHLAVEVVGNTDDDEIDFRQVQQAVIVGKMMGNGVLTRK